MPNLITHKIFAEEVLQKISDHDIKDLLYENEHLFYIGSNGPDPLFFYEATPWNLFHDNPISTFGNELHCGRVNDFYKVALHEIHQQTNPVIQRRMFAYLFGHLCHWAIDSSAHPYIYYRTGDCTGMSLNYHHRFESILDETVLRTYRHTDIRHYHYPDICVYDRYMLQAIARIYVPVIKKLFQSDILVYDIRKALNGWHDAQTWLYDPDHIKTDLWKAYEKLRHEKWAMSGNIVPNKNENDFDVMNLKKAVWRHPCDETIIRHESFPEIFQRAIETALKAITLAYHSQDELESLLHLLQDKAYDTGMAGYRTMLYFEIVFEK